VVTVAAEAHRQGKVRIFRTARTLEWIPACAGMTTVGWSHTKRAAASLGAQGVGVMRALRASRRYCAAPSEGQRWQSQRGAARETKN